jgi:acetyl esterase/lipase
MWVLESHGRACACMARAGAVLLSPWVDMTDTRPSQTKHEQYDYLPHDLVELFAAASCEGEAATSQGLGFARAFSKSGSATALADADGNNGGGSSPAPSSSGPVAVDRADPSVSPIYGDLSRLPPMLIHVGQCEVGASRTADQLRGHSRMQGAPRSGGAQHQHSCPRLMAGKTLGSHAPGWYIC